jgi:outer membrane receptor protein involved in Fe transport
MFRILLFTFLLAGLLFGQTTRGTIAGVVSDPSGNVVPGAKVSATSAQGGESRTVNTGGLGEFRMESLAPGLYSITVDAPGFSQTQVQNFQVQTSTVSSLNVALELATATQTVIVTEAPNQIQTDTGAISATVPTEQIRNLPIPTGNPFSLAPTLPGVVTVQGRDDFTNGASFSVNGLRPRSNNFLIDGFDNNDNGIGGQAYQPTNQEAVQEVTVLTNSYAPEYGRGGASVSNLTFRSGGNEFHGAAWYFFSGAWLDALSPEQQQSGLTSVPHYVNHTYGFRAGGPVVKNKLFLFGTSQWNRNFGASTFAAPLRLPTAAGVAALNSIGTNANVQTLLSSLGSIRGVPQGFAPVNVGNRPGCGSPCLIEVGTFQRFDATKSKSREWTVRADYVPSSTDTVYARYTDSYSSFSPDLYANSAALPYADTQQSGPSRIFGVMWTHTFSPRALNEFRFSGQQIDFGFVPLASTLSNPLSNLPTLSLSSSFGDTFWGGYSQGAFPQGRGHRTFQFQDAVSMVAGGHALRMGADITVLLVRDRIPFNANGIITFSSGGDCSPIGLTTCSDLANYIDNFTGGSGSVSRQFGNPLVAVPTAFQAYYVQDSWKVRPNLTVDYGVRYEYQPPDMFNILQYPSVAPGQFAGDPLLVRREVKADRNNFGPRISLAYSPGFAKGILGESKTVIRAGYGMFYDPFFTNIADNAAASSPNTLGFQQTGGTDPGRRGQAGATAFVNTISATASPLNAITSQSDGLFNPMIHQWNLNVQRQMPGRILAEAAYVGTRGQQLFVNTQVNPKDPNTWGGSTPTGTRIVPSRGSVVLRENRGDSNYHGLQTSLSRNSRRSSLRVSWTWSKAIDNQSEVFATSAGASRWENVFDPRSDRGPSAFDRRHRVSIAYVYELPMLNNHGLLTTVLGGWQSSGTISFQTGAPQTIYLGGWDQNGDGESSNDRPTLLNPSAKINYSDDCFNDPACISGVGYLDPSDGLIDFQTGAPGTFSQFRYLVYPQGSGVHGNVGRNTYQLPGQQYWNLSAMKNFRLFRESQYFQLRADFFNAFNHPNYGLVSSPTFGNILSGDFLNRNTTLGGSRSVTLWGKFVF